MVWNINNKISSTHTQVDVGLRSYMNKVYAIMSLGILLTAVITFIFASTPVLLETIATGPLKWVAFIAVLGLGWFAPKLIMSKSRTTGAMVFWVYSALWGIMIAPMIAFFLQTSQGAMDIARAFFITSAMFGATSLYGYVTKKDLSVFGRFFMMIGIGLLIAIIANIFIKSSVFSLFISFAVVLFLSLIHI